MAGFYDRLEDQLVQATERGVPRRGMLRGTPRQVTRRHRRAEWLAVAVAVAVCLVVAAAFVGLRPAPHGHRRAVPVTHRHASVPVIRNYAPGAAPPLGGQLFCDAALTAPHGADRPSGTVVVHTHPPTAYVYRITASGLKPAPRGEVYEIWLHQEVSLSSGGYQIMPSEPIILLGIIEPAVGASGRLFAQGLQPQTLNGTYRLLVTLQRRSAARLRHVVLQADGIL